MPGRRVLVSRGQGKSCLSFDRRATTSRAMRKRQTSARSRRSCATLSKNWDEEMDLTEHTMISWDGAKLFYRAWIPPKAKGKALLLFHRGHEHSGRWKETVDLLGLEDISVFAWDARGHGHSSGKRGAAGNFADVVKDVDALVLHMCECNSVEMTNVIMLQTRYHSSR